MGRFNQRLQCLAPAVLTCAEGLLKGAWGTMVQEPHVSSVKEAFEAMSALGGWAVYDNRAARRVSVGGSSASA